MLPPFTAIPFDHDLAHDQSIKMLQQPLLGESTLTPVVETQSTDEPSTRVSLFSKATLLVLLSGCTLGIAFSVGGFCLLTSDVNVLTRCSVLGYSLMWSFTTSVTAYLLFVLGWKTCGDGNLEAWNAQNAEYHFTLGVFIGFCLASTVTDILYGMSWINVTTTVIVAVAWAAIMMHFAALEVSTNPMKHIVKQQKPQEDLLIV